ncbi:MAG: radical SAM family heme chaperone HemW [Bacteroidales bacterium]|jgi:oxygen-independent coproporphyrinogen-3 oxidase|nr:radical SAM family heme chaperone HemW [Bacteroidales bacterium]
MAGIYIHIPYCKSFCSYCDFYHVLLPEDTDPLIDSLIAEASLRSGYLAGETVATIYIGGGTPSVLPADRTAFLLNSISKLFTVESGSEITIEINPDDTDTDYMKALLDNGFNRISIGVQSLRDQDLRLLNRRHTAKQASLAIESALAAGFGNVSVDLIYGIPGLDAEAWAENLDRTLSYGIKHLSAYHLTVEPGTLLSKMKEKGVFNETDEEDSNNQFSMLVEKTASAGFIQYEISNFALPGFFSVHNSNYWRQVKYLGLGPSAHSFNGYSRQWNERDVKKYIKSVKSGKLSFEREELDRRTRFNEYIMTSLRTVWGINLEYIEEVFEKEGYDYIVNLSGKLVDYGLMKQDQKTLVLTNQGKMISDNIISELMLPGND